MADTTTTPTIYRSWGTWADGAAGDTLTIDDAVLIFEGYGYDADYARRALLDGQTLRTPFADYSALTETERRAMDGDR